MTGAERVDWDTLRVGDPTPVLDEGRGCGEIQPHPELLPYRCTRLAGHGGRQHVATAGGRGVVAIWPVDGVA